LPIVNYDKNDDDMEDDINGLLHDTFRNVIEENGGKMVLTRKQKNYTI